MSSLNDQITIMKNHLNTAESEIEKLMNGRKSSAAKARSELMKVKTISHALRSDIMKYQKELPTKSRVSKTTQPEPEPELEQKPEPEQTAPTVSAPIDIPESAPKPKVIRRRRVKAAV